MHFTNIDEETCNYFQAAFKAIVKGKTEPGGYSEKEKEVYSDLPPVSIPFKKKKGVTEGKKGVAEAKKGGGVRY